MLDVRINGQSLTPILRDAPTITDQLNAVCRTLTFSVQNIDNLDNYLGQPVELWYNGARWFYGTLRKKGKPHDGNRVYTVYDPLYFLVKNPDDWYFKNITATQAIKQMAEKIGLKVYSIANTKAVFGALYYQNGNPDKIAIDMLARTYKATGKKFWFRYRPDYGTDGLHVFEKAIPKTVWAFQVGVNLVSAEAEESIEEMCTVVQLINRETGKIVTKYDDANVKAYGRTTYREEVGKEDMANMESKAKELLEGMSAIKTTMKIQGVNPNAVMPQFFSGDVVFVEEPNAQLFGAYHIINATHTFLGDVITLDFDLQATADIPAIQYTDATKNPNQQTTQSTTATKKTTTVKKPAATEENLEALSKLKLKKSIEEYGLPAQMWGL